MLTCDDLPWTLVSLVCQCFEHGLLQDMSSIGPCSDRFDDVYISPNWIRRG